MTARQRFSFVWLTLALLVAPRATWAQTGTGTGAAPSANFAALAAKVDRDQALTVTDTKGERVKGRLTRISADQLTVLGRDRSWTFGVADVSRVQRRDTIWNGLAIGAAAGAVTALLVVTNDCGTDTECSFYEGLAFYPLFAGGGAAIGAVTDALITKTLYKRAPGALHVAVQPVPRGAAVQVRMTF